MTEILLFSSSLITNPASDVWSMLIFSNLYLHFAFKSGAEVGLVRFWRTSSKSFYLFSFQKKGCIFAWFLIVLFFFFSFFLKFPDRGVWITITAAVLVSVSKFLMWFWFFLHSPVLCFPSVFSSILLARVLGIFCSASFLSLVKCFDNLLKSDLSAGI